MQPAGRILLFLGAGLAFGCAGPSRFPNGPHYGWLRKQGPATAERPGPPSPPDHPAKVPLPPAPDERPEASDKALTASVAPPTPNMAGRTPAAGTRVQAARPAREGTDQQQEDYRAEPDRRWNAKALAAAPIGIGTVIAGLAGHSIPVLLIGGAIAFALGLIGSRQCRDREDRGKAFALVGMVLGAAALFFSLMVLAWAA